MRLLLALLLCLAALPAHAGPGQVRALAVMSNLYTAFTINGYSAITSDSGEAGGAIALDDTGTQTGISTGEGLISIRAYCTSSTGNQTDVILTVDGVDHSISCINGETKSGVTLSWDASAGTHSIRVRGTRDSLGDYFSADTFRHRAP